jgi:hypothetical protein
LNAHRKLHPNALLHYLPAWHTGTRHKACPPPSSLPLGVPQATCWICFLPGAQHLINVSALKRCSDMFEQI